MNSMIKVLMAGWLAVGGAAVYANEAATADEKLQKMDETLNLTDSQEQQIRAILEDKKAQKDANANMSEADKQAIRDETDKKVRDVLTEEQKPKYDAMKEEMKKGATEGTTGTGTTGTDAPASTPGSTDSGTSGSGSGY